MKNVQKVCHWPCFLADYVFEKLAWINKLTCACLRFSTSMCFSTSRNLMMFSLWTRTVPVARAYDCLSWEANVSVVPELVRAGLNGQKCRFVLLTNQLRDCDDVAMMWPDHKCSALALIVTPVVHPHTQMFFLLWHLLEKMKCKPIARVFSYISFSHLMSWCFIKTLCRFMFFHQVLLVSIRFFSSDETFLGAPT
jgi:hypothetical protein